MDPQRHLSNSHLQAAGLRQGYRADPEQAAVMMSRFRLPQYGHHGEVYPGCQTGFTSGIVMRPALPHVEKEQPYPTGLHSLSPGEAEALYSCVDPKMWTEHMISPMMLPPMFDTYYNGLDFHAPGYRKNVTKETTGPLKAWLQDHRKNPYPTKAEKIMLAIITKMTLTQVSTWFANARRRLKKETGRSSEDDCEQKHLSDDEEDGSDISRSKEGSDNEDEEISVDDDSDNEISPPTTSSQRGSTSPLLPRDIFREHGSNTKSVETTGQSETRDDKIMSSTSKGTCLAAAVSQNSKHKTTSIGHLPESDLRPVDLSPSATRQNSHCEQHRQQQSVVGQRLVDRNNSPTNNSAGSKAKIWSISNILSLESSGQNTAE